MGYLVTLISIWAMGCRYRYRYGMSISIWNMGYGIWDMGYGISIWSSWISIRDICSLCLADDARHVIGCNGGQGESLVPSHTRGSLSLSLSLALYQRMPFNSRNEGTTFVPMRWRAISARPYRQGGGAEVKGDVPFALNPPPTHNSGGKFAKLASPRGNFANGPL